MQDTNQPPIARAVFPLLLFSLAIACLGQLALAQHLISTKAGLVNLAEGQVRIQRQNSEATEPGRASVGTQMQDGDQLITEALSRAEVLLTPGSFIRLGGQTAIRGLNTSLAQVRFELLTGSAIVEVSTLDKQTPLEIVTPQGTVSIAKAGVYRFDVRGSATLIRIYKGELFLEPRDQLLAKGVTKIGHGKSVSLTGVSGASPEIAQFDPVAFDDFDQWSFERAALLEAANHSVLSRSAWGSSSLAYGWTWSPFFNCYTFIPGSRRVLSPYGFSFYQNFGACGCSAYSYYPFYYPYHGFGTYSGGATLAPKPRSALSNGPSTARSSTSRGTAPGRSIARSSGSMGAGRSVGGRSGGGRGGHR